MNWNGTSYDTPASAEGSKALFPISVAGRSGGATKGAISVSRSSSLPMVSIAFIDPVVYSTRTEAARETGASALDLKPVEARYASPVTSRADAIDDSSMSLLGRSAAAAAKAAAEAAGRAAETAGRAAETGVEARFTPASAATTGAPRAGQTSAPTSQSAQGGGSRAQSGAAAPVSEPQPMPKGPSAPAKLPAQSVDLYVNQSRTKREDRLEPLDDAEGSDIL